MDPNGGGGRGRFLPFRPPPLMGRPNDPVHYVPVATQFCGLRSERLPQKSNNYVLAKNGLRPGGWEIVSKRKIHSTA